MSADEARTLLARLRAAAPEIDADSVGDRSALEADEIVARPIRRGFVRNVCVVDGVGEWMDGAPMAQEATG